ncbi:hypothetical protein KTS45_07660 [Halomicroarcula limicola]|uniref:DUF7344 domain-containing protein n=1 Tax=Haloarcula limicola TaxID=1429915 RepID=A0A8J7YA55_9EURY|nr:hypothetical protein [Halomicroarcula limicola]MBV0924079.1 hypothetical protein [Halomicroarcula limicola]
MDGERGRREIERVLADRRRRYLLYCLHLHSTPQPLPDIADQVTVWETSDPATERLDERLEIYLSLYHDHLPELVEAGVVTYRQTEDDVDWDGRVTPERLDSRLERRLCEELDALLDAETCTFDCDDGGDIEP